ncbi:MAG: DUF748 domain-containing protein [Candidatus Jettenia sp.]|nr:DUF748 domain-containing protein [Candidatus Jettenia sp.]
MSEQKSDTRRHQKKFFNTWYKQLFLWIAITAVVIFAFRLALDPIASYFTQQALDGLENYKGSFQDVSLSIIPPRYEITGVKIFEEPAGRSNEPFFFAERVKINMVWKQILKGTLVAWVDVDHPKVTVVKERVVPPEEKKPVRIPDIGAQLKKAPPLRIDRVEVNEAEIVFIDATEENQPRIWLHDMEVKVKNIATREKLARDMPTTVSANAILQKSGNLTFSLSANPWKKGLNFTGKTALKGLALTDLSQFAVAQSDLKPIKGTVDLFVSFEVEKNQITGGVKPILHNVDVAPEKPSFLDWIKSKVVDTTLSIFSGSPEQAPEQEKMATIIPIKGTITDPNPQILPTILGIIRNAFVEGITAGFANLPPPTAPEKEGVVEQVIDALTPGEGPPQAQPEKGKEKKE